ncbi:MAG: BatD family protein [bacterium]
MKSFGKRYAIPNAAMAFAVKACLIFLLLGCALVLLGCGTAEKGNKRPLTVQLQPVEVESGVDRSTITVGESVTYTLTVRATAGITPRIPDMGVKITGLRIIDMGAEGPLEEDGKRVWEKWYTLQADAAGSYVIPPAVVAYQDPNGGGKEVRASRIFVEAVAGAASESESADIRDIKPPEPMGTSLVLLYILTGLAVCALIIGGIVLGRFLRSRHKKETVLPPCPDEVALRELERLKASHHLDRNDYRSFYFELSGILRGYMEKRFGLPAQESTTEELIPRIEAMDLTRPQKDTVRVLSSGEDLVKFAQHTPDKEKALEDWEETRRFILETAVKQEPVGGSA